MARKLAGEAGEEELKELEQWQQQHPDEIYSLQILFDFWMSGRSENRETTEQAFDEHLLRMQQHAVQPAPADPSARPASPDPSNGLFPWKNVILNRRRGQYHDMLKNYFKVSWRSFSRNKIFSAINISGLAIGIASAVLLLLWINNEISADRFHRNADRIYEVYSRSVIDGQIQCW